MVTWEVRNSFSSAAVLVCYRGERIYPTPPFNALGLCPFWPLLKGVTKLTEKLLF